MLSSKASSVNVVLGAQSVLAGGVISIAVINIVI